MKKILAVDDEEGIRTLLKESLEMEGYVAYTAKNGMEAMESLKYQPDLIIMDINMPDIDGYTVCEKIRDYVDCPILFLTARTEEQDRVNGFKAGGDDYIVKPFGMEELMARVEAHLRREARHQSQARVRFAGELAIHYGEQRLFFGKEEIPLTKKEFDIVELLSQNPGQVFDKERIYEMVWGYDAEGDSNVIKEYVRKIRARLREVTGLDYIETVWGVGYKWKKDFP